MVQDRKKISSNKTRPVFTKGGVEKKKKISGVSLHFWSQVYLKRTPQTKLFPDSIHANYVYCKGSH